MLNSQFGSLAPCDAMAGRLRQMNEATGVCTSLPRWSAVGFRTTCCFIDCRKAIRWFSMGCDVSPARPGRLAPQPDRVCWSMKRTAAWRQPPASAHLMKSAY